VEGAQLVRDRGFLFGTHYRSLNVLTLLLAWRLLGRQWLAGHPLAVTVHDGFEKALDAAFKDNCDRWILMSQWSGRWGKGPRMNNRIGSRGLLVDPGVPSSRQV